ncbi:MAG: NAD(P)-dependent oxidoreductase [Burkholderiaceae bacterium]
MNRKALITGATGYIGAKLCQQLRADGWQIDVLVRETGRPLAQALADKVTPHSYDGNTRSVLDAVAAAKPDVVFHLASLFIAEHHSDQVAGLINSNLLFATQLAEACAHNGVKRFINTSTAWQHYRSDAYDPVCLYAATKQAFEDILDFYSDAFSMRVITLKLFDTYGPDDPRPKLLNLLLKAMENGEELGISPGDQLLDLVHINDVTRAFSICAQQLLQGASCRQHERYAVSSGATVSVRELVALLEQLSGKAINVTFGARPYRAREVMSPWLTDRHPPAWKAEIDTRSGLAFMLKSPHQHDISA